MENNTDLRKVVYSIMLTQIQFGTYRCGEKLPTIEETSRRLCVSIDTARTAYLKLKDEGYITLSKNVGATVKVNYDSQETEQFIQTFFFGTQKCHDRSDKFHAAPVWECTVCRDEECLS